MQLVTQCVVGMCPPTMTGLAVLAVSKGPQSQFRYCWWYRSSHGTDFDISEIAPLYKLTWKLTEGPM